MKISISIACYNQAEYLSKAIDSLLNQTYKNIEIIIADDYSCKEGQSKIFEGLIDKYSDFTYNNNKKNKNKNIEIIFYKSIANNGVARIQNKGLYLATGDYYSAISADSWYYPTAIEQMVLLAKKGYDFVVSESDLRDFYGNVKRTTDIKHRTLKPFNTFWSLSSIWSKKMHEDLQGFNENFKCTEPEFFMRAFMGGYKGIFIDEVLQGTLEHNENRKVGQWSKEGKKQVDTDIAMIHCVRQSWINANKPIFKNVPKFEYHINNKDIVITKGAYNKNMSNYEIRSQNST